MLPENQVTQDFCSAEPTAPGQALGLPLGPPLPPKLGGAQGGMGSMAGYGRSRGVMGRGRLDL